MIDELRLGEETPTLKYLCRNCQRESVVDLDNLELGSGDGPDIINLPACECGARTFLNRTWDSDPAADDPHRRAVNTLAEFLKAQGKSSSARTAEIHQAEVKAGKAPPFMFEDHAEVKTDILGRQARAQQLAEAAAAAEAKAQADAEAASLVEEQAAEIHLALLETGRMLKAKASVNKRLGLPPGSEPPADELAAELQKSVEDMHP